MYGTVQQSHTKKLEFKRGINPKIKRSGQDGEGGVKSLHLLSLKTDAPFTQIFAKLKEGYYDEHV